jgi:hypothetical protein
VRLPRMTMRRWMIVVAVVGIGLAVLSHWRSSRTPTARMCGPVFPVDPPACSRWVDPYETDSLPPDSPPPES